MYPQHQHTQMSSYMHTMRENMILKQQLDTLQQEKAARVSNNPNS